MGGPGLERVWNGMERGLERNGPLQHSTATTQHIFIKIGSFGAGIAQQAILRLPAGSSSLRTSLPSHNKVGSSSKCCRHRLANTITGLGHSKRILTCMHSCMYVRSCMCVQMYNQIVKYMCIYIYMDLKVDGSTQKPKYP